MEYLTEKLDCHLNSRQIWLHLVLAIRPKHTLMFHQCILFLKGWLLISDARKCRAPVELGIMEHSWVFRNKLFLLFVHWPLFETSQEDNIVNKRFKYQMLRKCSKVRRFEHILVMKSREDGAQKSRFRMSFVISDSERTQNFEAV